MITLVMQIHTVFVTMGNWLCKCRNIRIFGNALAYIRKLRYADILFRDSKKGRLYQEQTQPSSRNV